VASATGYDVSRPTATTSCDPVHLRASLLFFDGLSTATPCDGSGPFETGARCKSAVSLGAGKGARLGGLRVTIKVPRPERHEAAGCGIGRRLKCNGARWEAPNADRMAALCCLLYSEQWQTYWAEQVA